MLSPPVGATMTLTFYRPLPSFTNVKDKNSSRTFGKFKAWFKATKREDICLVFNLALSESGRIMMNEKIQRVKNVIADFPDFPKPGIVFKDIFPILRNPSIFQDLIDVMVEHVKQLECDIIIGLEARGFLFGPIIALQLGLPFVPIRKKGKLPGETEQITYKLEYGEDVFECQKGSVHEGQRVVIVDDLLATGGTMYAACQMVTKLKATVVECLVIITLKELDGTSKVPAKVHSLIELSEFA